MDFIFYTRKNTPPHHAPPTNLYGERFLGGTELFRLGFTLKVLLSFLRAEIVLFVKSSKIYKIPISFGSCEAPMLVEKVVKLN